MGVAGCIANVLQSCGGSGGGGPAPATQGTAGTPGTWLPPGSNPPSDATQATADLALMGVACPRLPDYVDRLVAFYRTRRGQVRREAMV